MPPPALPLRNVSWKVFTKCNYRCTYCLQPSFDEAFPADIEGTVDVVHSCLETPYETKIAGGELMASPARALRLVRRLEQYGHWISICSNLSASLASYIELVEATRGKFYHIQASLHLEYVEPDQFLEKCLGLIAHLPHYSKLVVNNVITHGSENIERLGEIKRRFEDAGIVFYTDLLTDTRGQYHAYTPEERLAIDTHLGVERRLFETRGELCRAGDTYFILLPNLDAWKCWDGYLRNDRKAFLGNMREKTFALPRRITVCPYDTCSCPTPLIKHRFKLVHGTSHHEDASQLVSLQPARTNDPMAPN